MKTALVKSPHLVTIKEEEMHLIWHSLFGYPQIINQEGVDLLERFSAPCEEDEVVETGLFEDAVEKIAMLKNCYFLIPENFDERGFLAEKTKQHEEDAADGKKIEYLSIIPTELCNFSCTYCISNSMINATHRRDKLKTMPLKTAKTAVDVFLSVMRVHGKKVAFINFGGGEPLLNWPVVRDILYYCRKNYGQEFEFLFRINSNGSLINDEIAKTFKDFDVKVALSLDGLKTANDKVRKSRSGKGTFEKIVAAIELLKKHDFPTGGFSVTVTEDNFDLIDEDLLDFAEKNNLKDLRVDIDVIHMLKIPVETAAKKLLQLKTSAISRGINLTGFWERAAENLNTSILEKHIAFCGGVAGRSLCVSPQGDAFICGYSAERYAGLASEEIRNSIVYEKIVTGRLAGNIKRCQGCILEGQCIGGCHITEEYGRLGDHAAMEYNCSLYRIITVELLKISLREALSTIPS